MDQRQYAICIPWFKDNMQYAFRGSEARQYAFHSAKAKQCAKHEFDPNATRANPANYYMNCPFIKNLKKINKAHYFQNFRY